MGGRETISLEVGAAGSVGQQAMGDLARVRQRILNVLQEHFPRVQAAAVAVVPAGFKINGHTHSPNG